VWSAVGRLAFDAALTTLFPPSPTCKPVRAPAASALLGLLVAAALAGCTGSTTSTSHLSTSAALQVDEGANRIEVPHLPTSPPQPGERNLTAAPQWRLGEWWDYTLTDHLVGNEVHIRRVVAGTFGGSYLVGFPVDGFSNDALVLHVPGYGDIAQSDLSFEVHDVPFQPLSFPLVAGKTWPTAFEGRPGNATVLSADAATGQAVVRITDGTSFNWTATYDAVAGDLVKLDDPNYATAQVTAHGYNHTGVVRVPHAHDLVFQNGRLGPWDIRQDPTKDPTPAPQDDVVTIAPGYDHLAFVLLVGGGPNFLFGGPVPDVGEAGVYNETVTSPNGTVYALSAGPADHGIKVRFFGAADPVGDWVLHHQADGPGLVLTEGIGYHVIDVRLPGGCVLPGPNAGHHLNPCTGQMGNVRATTSTTTDPSS